MKTNMLDACHKAYNLYENLVSENKTNGELILDLAPKASKGELIPYLALAAHLIIGLTEATGNLEVTLAAIRCLAEKDEEN